MILTDRQWKSLLPVIRGGAKELDIRIDKWGNAKVVAKGKHSIYPPLQLKGNVIAFPLRPQIKSSEDEGSLKSKVNAFLDRIGLVLWGEEDDDDYDEFENSSK